MAEATGHSTAARYISITDSQEASTGQNIGQFKEPGFAVLKTEIYVVLLFQCYYPQQKLKFSLVI